MSVDQFEDKENPKIEEVDISKSKKVPNKKIIIGGALVALGALAITGFLAMSPSGTTKDIVNGAKALAAENIISSKLEEAKKKQIIANFGEIKCESDKVFDVACQVFNIEMDVPNAKNGGIDKISLKSIIAYNPEDIVKKYELFKGKKVEGFIVAGNKSHTLVSFNGIQVNGKNPTKELFKDTKSKLVSQFGEKANSLIGLIESEVEGETSVTIEDITTFDKDLKSVSQSSFKLNIGKTSIKTSSTYSLTKEALELNIKDISKLTAQELEVHKQKRLKGVQINKLEISLIGSKADLIGKILKEIYTLDKGTFNQDSYDKELAVYSNNIEIQVDKLVTAQAISPRLGSEISTKLISIIEGKDSSITISLTNKSNLPLEVMLQKGMGAYMLGDLKSVGDILLLSVE